MWQTEHEVSCVSKTPNAVFKCSLLHRVFLEPIDEKNQKKDKLYNDLVKLISQKTKSLKLGIARGEVKMRWILVQLTNVRRKLTFSLESPVNADSRDVFESSQSN